ncbi:hypothetical protein GN156_10875 [bacterium LRH843]|nr:hypothetical protein [bacterium LRH843]
MASTVWLEPHLVWNLPLLAFLTFIAVFYAFAIKRNTTLKLYHKQPLFFFLGLGILYVSTGSPLSTISHLSFSFHMIQMSVLYFIIPPVLLLGIPDLLLLNILKARIIRTFSKLVLAPKLALVIFAVLFLMYHFPVVLNVLSQSHFIRSGYTLLLLLLAFTIWWPIASPDPKLRYYKSEKKRYVFLSGLLLMPACAFFIITALMNDINNPFLTQLTAGFCLPVNIQSLHLLPPLFNTKVDQISAGFFMLGVHKLGLYITYKLGNHE